jgi:hypothetical protein
MKIITVFLAIIFLCINGFGYASMPCCQNNVSEITTSKQNCHSDNTDNQTDNADNTEKKQCNMAQCNICVRPILLDRYSYNIFIISDYTIVPQNISIYRLSIAIEQPPQIVFV